MKLTGVNCCWKTKEFSDKQFRVNNANGLYTNYSFKIVQSKAQKKQKRFFKNKYSKFKMNAHEAGLRGHSFYNQPCFIG